jgi:D-amino peptidase
MKVHITADIEGVAVICHDEQGDQKGWDYDRMRRIMTGEVEAAILGAKDGGADEILVCDAHDTGRNLLIEELPEDVEVIEGSAYDMGMMSGISDDFDASFQVGYHSMRHTHAGVLGHTYTYSIAELRMNGITLGEGGLSAAIAGHYGVPVTMVSGDSRAIAQVRQLVKGFVEVPTKQGVGLYGVRTLTPKKACQIIREGAKEAVQLAGKIKPFVLRKPIQMQVEFERPLMAEYAAQIPTVKRKDIKTVTCKSKDVIEAFKVFETMNRVASYAKSEGPL